MKSVGASWRADAVAAVADRLRAFRNRLVGDPKVQEFVISNRLTRGIARYKARELFDLCAGFVYSQILKACLELGLFEKLRDGDLSLAEIAREADLSLDAMRRLVDAGISLRLLERRRGDRVGLGELGAALNANPGIKAMVRHHADLYEDLRDPVALLRGEVGSARLNAYWPYATAARPADLSSESVADYCDLMSASQKFIAQEVLASYPIERHKRLLDVGGGDGTFALAAAKSAPHLEVCVFDLPAVARRATERILTEGLGGRAEAIGGDFVRDRLPSGADLISLVRVLYDHGDETVLALLKAVHAALPSGGRLLIAEPMADAPGAERVGDAYFGFYLLAMGSGRARRPVVLTEMLKDAGFSRSRIVPTRMPLQTGLVIAEV